MIVVAVVEPARRGRRRTEFGLPARCGTYLDVRTVSSFEDSSRMRHIVRCWLVVVRADRRRTGAGCAGAGGALPGAAARRVQRRPGDGRDAGVPGADASPTTSRGRRSWSPSIRCRARSSRSSTSTAISRRRSPPSSSRAVVAGDGRRSTCGVLVNPAAARAIGWSQALEAHQAAQSHRAAWCCSPTSTSANVGPGLGAKAAAQLEADVKAGAVGLGEIIKGFGLRYAQGRRHRACKLDDPELDPVWAAAGAARTSRC